MRLLLFKTNDNKFCHFKPTQQGQILLHEDEDGQLYFKNEHGKLQPVYMTEDGNYAIAEASNDEESSQESGAPQTQQEHQQTLEIQQQQLQQIIDDAEDGDTYVLPDAGMKPVSKKVHKYIKTYTHTVKLDDLVWDNEH